MSEVGGGAYRGETGTDIIDGRRHCGKDRLQALASVKCSDQEN